MTVHLFVKETDSLIAEYSLSENKNYIEFYRDDLTEPEYYLLITTTLPQKESDSWKYPFKLNIDYIGAISKLSAYSSPPSIEANNVSKATIRTEIQDPYGNLIGTAENEVHYKIISGGDYGTLVGANPAKAVGGISEIRMQSSGLPGRVDIECSAPGLAPDTISVYTYENGYSTKVNGRITSNTTWLLSSSPYEVTGDITIDKGVVLTIEPGVVVKFRKNTDIFVKGGLSAEGNKYYPIIFTSASDTKLAGDWGGIIFEGSTLDNQSALKYCEFYYGASSGYGEVHFPVMLDLRANPSISDITIKDCNINAVGLADGTYNVDVKLDNPGVPVWIGYDIHIGEGAVLTIAPGTLIKMGKDKDLRINGGLYAVGTVLNPIVFTSYKDDSRGGDTNNDGSSRALAGDWGGIKFESTTMDEMSELKNCSFYYGASNSYGETHFPILLDLRANPTLMDLTIQSCRINAIGLMDGTYNVDVYLNDPGVPVWMGGDIRIGGGAVFTIAPGTVIKMGKDVDLRINGGLKAIGTKLDPIVFTSYKDDSFGGDSNNDGSSDPLPGDWGGIKFESSTLDVQSTLKYCTFYFGASSSYGEVPFPILLDLRANPSISDIKIKDCRVNALGLIGGTYKVDVQLNNPGVPIWMSGDTRIDKGAVLTIDSGTLIKMGKDVDLRIGGGLIVNGTRKEPVTFTSYKDDSMGGDSNNDGSSDPLPGDWGGISFEKTTLNDQARLKYCMLYYAGSGSYGEIHYPLLINNAHPLVEYITIKYSKNHGIYLQNQASPDLGGGANNGSGANSFLDFNGLDGRYAIYNAGTENVYARYNYWEKSDSEQIADIIYDHEDNSAKGVVYFEPINNPPGKFFLISPEDDKTINSFENTFTWLKAQDDPTDTLSYHLHIYSRMQDTTIVVVQDTSFRFNGKDFYKEYYKYHWYVDALDQGFTIASDDTFSFFYDVITGLKKDKLVVSGFSQLSQNYPNPFNPTTTITYRLKKTVKVSLIVYDILGREVARLVNGRQNAGKHQVRFNANNLASGVYIYRLKTGNFEQVRKMLLLR